MSGLVVRGERAGDVARVREIQRAAFGRDDEADLVDALRTAAHPQLSLVAETDAGAPVAHVFFSPVSIEAAPGAPPCAGLAPLGVLPELQGRGAGALLVREGLARCRDVGWKAVFLLGNPAYYRRFGFELAAPRGFRFEGEQSAPFFQLVELETGALCGCQGRVVFHDAFASLS